MENPATTPPPDVAADVAARLTGARRALDLWDQGEIGDAEAVDLALGFLLVAQHRIVLGSDGPVGISPSLIAWIAEFNARGERLGAAVESLR